MHVQNVCKQLYIRVNNDKKSCRMVIYKRPRHTQFKISIRENQQYGQRQDDTRKIDKTVNNQR